MKRARGEGVEEKGRRGMRRRVGRRKRGEGLEKLGRRTGEELRQRHRERRDTERRDTERKPTLLGGT